MLLEALIILGLSFGAVKIAEKVQQEKAVSSMPYESVMPENTQTTSNKVLVAKTTVHKGALFGHVANGGGMINLGNGYGLQFINDGSQFVVIQLFLAGINSAISHQTYQRTKKVMVKPVQKQLETIKVADKALKEEIL